MKAIGVLVVLAAILVVAGCGKQKVVDESKLVERGGLKYEVNSEKPFTGKAVEYWSNGQKKSEDEYQDGKENGKGIAWFENGQKLVEMELRDGVKNGKEICWYENGQKCQEAEYRDGKANGKVIIWSKNGQKMSESEWRDGTEVSRIEWDTNGNLIK